MGRGSFQKTPPSLSELMAEWEEKMRWRSTPRESTFASHGHSALVLSPQPVLCSDAPSGKGPSDCGRLLGASYSGARSASKRMPPLGWSPTPEVGPVGLPILPARLASLGLSPPCIV